MKTVADNAKKFTFGDVGEMWIKNREWNLKESSVSKYRNYLSWYIFPKFKNRKIKNITGNMVKEFCLNLLRFGGKNKQGLSVKTVKDIYNIIKQIFKYAKYKNIPVGAIGEFPELQERLEPFRVFNAWERKRLFDYLCKSDNIFDIGILLSLTTGIRLGELCALRWDDFFFRDQKLRIRRTLSRIVDHFDNKKKTKIIITEPKTRSSIRVIPLSSGLCEILLPLYKEGTFFLTGSRQKFAEPRAMQYRFKTVLKKCELKDANFHALRHTFATGCVEANLDIKTISEILGHSNINITMNRYVHPSMEAKLNSMEKVFDKFEGL